MKTREENPNGSFIIYEKKIMATEEADRLKKLKADRYQERLRKATSAGGQKGETVVKPPVTGQGPGSSSA